MFRSSIIQSSPSPPWSDCHRQKKSSSPLWRRTPLPRRQTQESHLVKGSKASWQKIGQNCAQPSVSGSMMKDEGWSHLDNWLNCHWQLDGWMDFFDIFFWRMDGFLSKPSWLNCHWATHFGREEGDVRGVRRWVNAFSVGNALCYRTDCWLHTSSWWSISHQGLCLHLCLRTSVCLFSDNRIWRGGKSQIRLLFCIERWGWGFVCEQRSILPSTHGKCMTGLTKQRLSRLEASDKTKNAIQEPKAKRASKTLRLVHKLRPAESLLQSVRSCMSMQLGIQTNVQDCLLWFHTQMLQIFWAECSSLWT